MNKTKIKFAVTSTEGHSEFELLPKEALAKIKRLEQENDKWVFIGNDHVKSEVLTEQDLIDATTDNVDITLVTSIAGGCEDCTSPVQNKVVKIDIETVKDKKGIVINFEVNDYEKIVDIKLGKDTLIDVLYDRDIIIRALTRKLENMATAEVEGLATALNVSI